MEKRQKERQARSLAAIKEAASCRVIVHGDDDCAYVRISKQDALKLVRELGLVVQLNDERVAYLNERVAYLDRPAYSGGA